MTFQQWAHPRVVDTKFGERVELKTIFADVIKNRNKLKSQMHFGTPYLNGRDHLADLGGNGRIILKYIFEK